MQVFQINPADVQRITHPQRNMPDCLSLKNAHCSAKTHLRLYIQVKQQDMVTCAYINKLVKWSPRSAIVHRHVDDIRLSVDILTPFC